MAMDIIRYGQILEGGDSEFRIPSVNTVIPTPTDDDYKIGYIQRYFIQKRSDESAYIYEVEKYYYTDILSNSFLKGITLKWKISGKREEVQEMNRKSIRFVTPQIKSIGLYLPNHLQFHKEIV